MDSANPKTDSIAVFFYYSFFFQIKPRVLWIIHKVQNPKTKHLIFFLTSRKFQRIEREETDHCEKSTACIYFLIIIS